jgi:hypothetical protein
MRSSLIAYFDRLMPKPWLAENKEITAECEVNSDCVLTPQHLWYTGAFSLTLQ